jgi:diadenosine tetraphosphatase ApaH/serine/threonine PP2A family protein phosphatase
MKAIISDIHGNLEALQAVLEDIQRQGADDIYCLGDLVGYGPNPGECIDLAMAWKVVLLGNFDAALFSGYDGFGVIAQQSMEWTSPHLDAVAGGREFLAGRPHTHEEGEFLFVHGSARNPLHEYVFPEDIYNPAKMTPIFAKVNRYCFHGHTHVPGLFTADLHYLSPDEVDGVYRLTKTRTLVNVGSVGQPRDKDWRACYVLLDGETVRFRRVEYDVDATVKKIHAIAELANFSGDRLREGK